MSLQDVQPAHTIRIPTRTAIRVAIGLLAVLTLWFGSSALGIFRGLAMRR
jgi:spore maturation protein SpmA